MTKDQRRKPEGDVPFVVGLSSFRKRATMHIGIDASRVTVAERTGTEHYTFELLAALAQLDRQNRYTLYCNQPPAALPPLGSNFSLRQIPFPRLWTHAR